METSIMETNKILQSDTLDILFENRNKEYGAYELRRHYHSRLSVALLITGGLGLIFFMSSFLYKPQEEQPKQIARAVELTSIAPEEKLIEPEKIKPVETQPVRTEPYMVPKVVPNDQVPEDQKPPTMDQLDSAAIGTTHIDGDAPTGNETPVKEAVSSGVIEAPVTKEPDIFLKVEQEAEFPGGNKAWSNFISKEVSRNIEELQDDGKSGTVVAQFVVDTEGNVSDVKVLGCNEATVANCIGTQSKLAEIAIAAIKRGPKWKPAEQNGRKVKAYRRQPITFKLEQE
ncbi:MAG: energy transducer TonB [Sphingobacteriales bacterium]|nr:MAG: energy transducer TonB [Sphingobacteriales bacterium]